VRIVGIIHMAFTRRVLLDWAFILVGAAISIIFVSIDGNGQNPLPVAGDMMIVVLGNGLVHL
jgi:hypothetical protein